MSNQMLSRMMGGHPMVIKIKGVFLIWMICGALFGAAVLVWIYTSGGVAFAAGLAGLFLLLGSLSVIGKSLVLLLYGLVNWATYRKAIAQIEAGYLIPSYAIQGSRGICVVDEVNRRIFANGCVFAFDDVRCNLVTCHGGDTSIAKHYVEIRLKPGTSCKIYFHKEAMTRNLAYRLDCSIWGAR